jgi:hypothetical protein
MNNLRKFYRTEAFLYAFWMVLIVLLILANWALMSDSPLLLLLVSAVGIVFSAISIYIERLNFKHGDIIEPAYTTRVIKQIALLTISLGLCVMAIILISGILN